MRTVCQGTEQGICQDTAGPVSWDNFTDQVEESPHLTMFHELILFSEAITRVAFSIINQHGTSWNYSAWEGEGEIDQTPRVLLRKNLIVRWVVCQWRQVGEGVQGREDKRGECFLH